MKSLSGIAALRRAVKEEPYDLDRRLVLADALEEVGSPREPNDSHFQRTLVEFCRFVENRLGARPIGGWKVGVDEFSVNARVYYAGRNRYVGTAGRGNATTYCWVSRYLGQMERGGMVKLGGFRAPAGPVRFWLTEGPQVWEKHVGTYGLHYLDQLRKASDDVQ